METEIKNFEITNNLTPTDRIILEFIKINCEWTDTDILSGSDYNRIVETGADRFQKRRIAAKLSQLQHIARMNISN